MEEMKSGMRIENLESRRLVEVTSQEHPMLPRLEPMRDNARVVGKKDKEGNRILVKHERNRALNDRANGAHD